ncbi:diaminopimelate decarboxylase [Ilyobacter polytropus]|uniref:Diaminopimelate decarboxylase n=1 Tax=Ilyobacter polytropus (strain ATCC 51220 / DSM 2926 / LMG 16218 / CuHBu1) TaxID=572544 RepID=E3HCN2_ILYPC|nr:diaminopimelate decarboxylase [Ilyobacter polytropus]ADO84427.1 diaminopimelate decarboxylase [Ilyobacter polytropus DSM 2926]
MRLFGSMEIKDNQLYIGGISSKELVEKHGSPLYVMDEALISKNMETFKAAFKSDRFQTEVVYASKAFLTTGMCQIVDRHGLSMDVVSGGELFTVKSAGFPMEKVHMHGNNKTWEELEMCLDYGIGEIIVDNRDELDKLERVCREKGKKINVLLRVNPGIEAHTHEYIQTSTYSSKFGESIFDENIKDIIKKFIAAEHVELKGFHCHIGSQIFDEKPFFAAMDTMLKFIKQMKDEAGLDTTVLNLGGGFGVYYFDGDDAVDFEKFCKEMIKDLESKLDEYEIDLDKVIIEPGRSIVANAGTTLYTVGGTKVTYSGKKYVFVDGGMTDNIRPALYQAEYEGVIANRINEKTEDLVTVAGKCCESGDLLLRDVYLQEAKEGDILAISTTGAYNYSMASNYNRIRKPAVVFVKDGESKVAVKRESYEDLIRNDLKLY